jgi:hypothetical protein
VASRRLTSLPLGVRGLFLYGGVAVLLWLPFGFRTNGLVEEWDVMWLLDRGQQLWWITGSSAVAFLRLRPLSMAPESLVHALGGGFIWMNVLTLVALALKGLATFQLVDRVAPGRRPAAWIAGGLALLYPINTGLFTMRMTHIDIAVVMFLYALVVLCDIVRNPRWWRVLLMWLLLAASLLIYQIALLATLVGPVVLVLIGVRAWRRLVLLSAVWFAALAAVGGYWLVVASQGGAYEIDSAKGQRLPFNVYAHDFVESYIDQLFRGWRPTAWVTWSPGYIMLAVICGVAVGAAAFFARNDGQLASRSSLLGGIGLIAIAPLGFLPYWAIVAAIHVTLKVYLLSSVAVAAGVALILGFVLRRASFVAVCGAFLVGLAALYGLHQHAHYVSLAERQARVLGEMVQQLPSPPEDTTIVVHDRSGQLGAEWTGGPPVTFAASVSVAYHNPTLRVALCDDVTGHAYLNGDAIVRCPVAGLARKGAGRPPLLAVFDYDLVHELRLVNRPKGSLPTDYAPQQLAGKGPPIRRSVLPCWPVQPCTQPPSASFPKGYIDQPFDNNMLNVTGVRAGELAPDGTPFRWTDARVMHIYANLPSEEARFRLQILSVLKPTVLSSIELRINGVRVPTVTTREGSRYIAAATIPAAALRASPDDVAISSDTVHVPGSVDGLGLAVTRVNIATVTP